MLGLGFGFTSESTLRRASGSTDVGGAALLIGEADGFGVDFTYATDGQRVAVKASSVVTSYALDAFFSNTSTSPKQVYDVAGALVWSPHNMALQSQTFEQATPWNLTTALTVTANAIAAPDGTLTADRLVETATTTNHQALHANITITVGATYTLSVYAKAGERTWLALALTNVSPADWFDLANGVMGTTANGGTITSVGNGWYRCTITGIAAGSLGPVVFIRTANAQAGTYLGDITKGLYVWGAQLNRGSTPTAYVPTTAAARYGLAVDYDPVTHAAKGLLVEPAATNLLPRSNEFSNASWVKTNGAVTADVVSAPDGTATADALVPITGFNSVTLSQTGITVTNGSVYTFSAYVKLGTMPLAQWMSLEASSGSVWRVWFDLTTGAKGSSSGSPVSYTSTAVGNNWYRITLSFTAGATTASVYLNPHSADGSINEVWSDAGTTTAFYAWGAQLETGPVATSLIPTFAATVTRILDTVSCLAPSINPSATAGSWWCEFATAASLAASRIVFYSLTAIPLYFNTLTTVGLTETTTLTKAAGTMVDGLTHRTACAFQSGDRAITALGLAPGTDAGATTLLLGHAGNISFGAAATVNTFNGYIRKAFYLPRRMTNTELTTKTA